MATDPKDGGPTTESREEKRVEVSEPAPPTPAKETVTETTTVEREN